MHRLSIGDVARVLKNNNDDTGGRIVIQNGYEWMVQAKGYIKDLDDIRSLVIATEDGSAAYHRRYRPCGAGTGQPPRYG